LAPTEKEIKDEEMKQAKAIKDEELKRKNESPRRRSWREHKEMLKRLGSKFAKDVKERR